MPTWPADRSRLLIAGALILAALTISLASSPGSSEILSQESPFYREEWKKLNRAINSRVKTFEEVLGGQDYFKKRDKVMGVLARVDTGLDFDQEERVASFIANESLRHGYDPELILAVISVESSFNNWSESRAGAIGLMQLFPSTGRELAEIAEPAWIDGEPLYDPFVNIRLGIQYLRMLHEKFRDLRLALLAYNYGPARVLRWLNGEGGIEPAYAARVLETYRNYLQKNTPQNPQTS